MADRWGCWRTDEPSSSSLAAADSAACSCSRAALACVAGNVSIDSVGALRSSRGSAGLAEGPMLHLQPWCDQSGERRAGGRTSSGA